MPNTMKRCRKSKLGMAGGGGWLARDDAESTSWRASCSELKILNFTPKLGKSFVFSKSRCFFFPFWQHFGGRIGGGSNKGQKKSI